MSILDKFERKYAKYAPEHITNVLLIGQALTYVFVYSHPEFAPFFYLSGRQLFAGQLWRIIAVMFAPLSGGLFFTVLALYFFYIFGNALEQKWGAFRYLVYIIISTIGLIAFTLLFPDEHVSNIYMYTSLFLAFAHLYPEFQLLLFFIIPVKVKWLGYISWIILITSFLFESVPTKVLILFSVSNFIFFFFSDIRYSFWRLYKGAWTGSKKSLNTIKPHHICAVCGQNEISNPDMEIRYCSQCNPTTCYCGEHIKKHQHKRIVN